MKTKTVSKRTKLDRTVKQYIIDCIDNEGYGGAVLETPEEKLQFLYDTFVSEYVNEYNIRRHGSYQNIFREYLMGIPSCIRTAFSNYDIIMLAKNWGSLPENATEKQEDRILENYFNLIANKTFQLFRKYKIQE